MKIVFAGKGGAGKTAMAVLFARALIDQGRSVTLIDCDLQRGATLSLAAASRRGGGGDRLPPNEGVMLQWLDHETTVVGPQVLEMGGNEERDLIADLPAGAPPVLDALAAAGCAVLVAVEPSPASALAARSILVHLSRQEAPAGLVVTKARTSHDVERVPRELAPLLLGDVPFDSGVRRAERRGSLLEIPAASPALDAARRLLPRVERLAQRGRAEVAVLA